MNTMVRGMMVATLFGALWIGGAALAQMGHGHGHSHGHGAAPMGADHGGHGMDHGGHEMAPSASELEFLVHMIPHHQEAVDSSLALLARISRHELRAFAEAIIAAQAEEIALMQGWLTAWYADAAHEGEYHLMMRELGPEASVEEVEIAWLEDMIHHHMMAVHESQAVLAGDFPVRDEVRTLAQAILNEQMREIMQMRLWLIEWYGIFPSMSMHGGGHQH